MSDTCTEDGRLSVTYGPDRVDLTILTAGNAASSLTIHLDKYQAHNLGTGLNAWAAGQGVDL